MKRWKGLLPWLVAFSAICLALGVGTVWAQEHPEHPEQQEPPEHPDQPKIDKPVTVEAVADYVEWMMEKRTAESGGWWTVHDDKENTDLKLQLDKVHRERLAKTADKTYFVCADFKTPEGKVYDLDFWVVETEDSLEITETMVHKEEGQPRYNWYEEGGIWKRKPVE